MNRIPQIVLIAAAALFFAGIGPAGFCADYQPGVKVQVVKKATRAANGQELAYPKTANPEVTVATVEIPPGGETGWHSHPFPVYAYVMSGVLSVAIEGGSDHEFREGEAIIEVIDTRHNGRNRGSVPVKLVVFYTGALGGQNTVTAPR
jgi:quercetin dioxygenase-like cupin family protein